MGETRLVSELTILELATRSAENDGPVLYIPHEHRERILRLYGGFTVLDFDEVFDFNTKNGKPYDNCYKSTMYWMNMTEAI